MRWGGISRLTAAVQASHFSVPYFVVRRSKVVVTTLAARPCLAVLACQQNIAPARTK